MMNNTYFTLEHITDGVWAAIVVPGSGALGNAAILDLGDVTVVVDTFMLPQAGDLLRQAAVQLTGREVEYVINTHFHGDHHYGNQSFPDSIIVSTDATRDYLFGLGDIDYEKWRIAIREQITSLSDTRSKQTDQHVISALTTEIADKEVLYGAVPSIRRVVATVTIPDRFVIHGSQRTAEVMTWGGGHTLSDAFVYIPENEVLIAGDLVLGQSHLMMLHGNIEEWLGILERMEQELEIKRIVPGHGPVTDAQSIREAKNYLRDVEVYAKQAEESGQPLEYWLEKGVLKPYGQWYSSHVFEWNFRHLYKYNQIAKLI
ncbi:MBL fold metallo-hydrolase [Paenibacillus sp. N1-5-1-14]|uniref:MBL fold metallo-hydrolase n=1 Tax=Paenibacillus radicibacter TaxID=2972488 RepID=UPI002159A7D0|nr:MBL fold metallo-hydrolase [Paenibacillus radicibacter]MCR8644426.1 MBL fold metallo-hydrolase [Paenibacillus radicibacter]